MKSFLSKKIAKPVLKVLLFSFAISQAVVFPLQAAEFTNISDVKDCRGITGDAERLACYDTVVEGGVFNEQQLRQVKIDNFGSDTMPKESTPAPVETAEPVAAQASQAAPEKEESAPPVVQSADSANQLYVTIVRLQKDSRGVHYFQTSEGQVWKQQNAGSWSKEVPFEAKIEAGSMGSFFLVNEGGKSTRVKRVR